MINDTSGHATGDELLRQVAARLKSVVSDDDMVARLGGDEFTVILTSASSTEAITGIAEKIIATLASPFQLHSVQAMVSISIGIATFPSDGDDAATLLKNADVAMYRAKEQGRNNFQFFTETMNLHAIERMTLASDMLKGLSQGEFFVVYQPQYNLKTGQLIGCEALARWAHPARGILPPSVFIPVAELTGAIEPLGDWVMQTAITQCQCWRDMGLPSITLAVNLSVRQLVNAELPCSVAAVLTSTHFDAKQLEFDITESMLMENIDKILQNLKALRDMGITLAIDDFGTGYSSLAYLKKLPIDKLKIDRSFVNDIAISQDSAKIVTATIALGKSLNLTVIAEGIETDAQLQFLRAQGGDEGQGYYLGMPMPAEDMQRLLQAEMQRQSEVQRWQEVG